MNRIISDRGRGLITASLLLLVSLIAAGASPTSRTLGTRTVLARSVAPVFSGATVLRRADLRGQIEFMVALKMRNYAEMLARVAKGEIISAQEMQQKYYPLEADYKTVTDWLGSEGLTITQTDPNHLGVFVSGTVGQVQKALQVHFGRVMVANKTYSSALTAPSVPDRIEPLIIGINGLQPHIQPHKHSHRVPAQSSRVATGPSPSSAQTPNQPPYLVSEILKAYNANGLTVTGSGQKIAIVIDTFPADSDLTSFWATNGVSQDLSHIEKVRVVSGTLPPAQGEETLDVEWSSGIAQSAKVRIYATKDFNFINIDRAFQAILNDVPTQPELHQVSISFGLGETFVAPSQLQADAQYFASMAANGLSVFASSGDGGSQEGGITQATYYASDPSVTAVGGTTLTLGAVSGAVASETVWNNFGGASGGGISTFFARPFWQTGVGVPSGSTRLVPDVSSAADPSTGALVILNGQEAQFGGTSWSAPVWAGFCALINQARADASLPPAALLGPKLYPLLRTTAYRDILVGSNGAYRAGLGYDLCTGVGAPNISVLLSPLTGGPTPPPAPVPPPYGEIFDPQPDSMLPSSTVTFSWTAGDATSYWLLVGTAPGKQDIFSSGQIGTQSVTVRNIPADGRPIFVILLSFAQGKWYTQAYQYGAAVENVAAPIINPNGGTFRRRVNVKLTEITPGAAIFYTTDGSTPTIGSTLYQSPFILKSSRTVKAVAIIPGVFAGSDVTTVRFIIRRRGR